MTPEQIKKTVAEIRAALKKMNAVKLYHYVNGEKIGGNCTDMTGDCSGLWGGCSGLSGNGTGLWGNCTDMTGDCSGLWGGCSGLSGNCTGLWGNCTDMTGDCSGLWGGCTGLLEIADHLQKTIDRKDSELLLAGELPVERRKTIEAQAAEIERLKKRINDIDPERKS